MNFDMEMQKLINLLKIMPLFFAVCAFASAPNHSQLEIKIDQKALENGQVVVISKLNNQSENIMRFLPWNTPFDKLPFSDAFNVYRVDGVGDKIEQVTYEGIMLKRTNPIEADYLYVSPDDQIDAILDITKLYSFCYPNTYIVELSSSIKATLTSNDFILALNENEVRFETNTYFINCGQS